MDGFCIERSVYTSPLTVSTRFEYRDGFDISGAVVVAPSERATLAVVACLLFFLTNFFCVFFGPFVGGGYDETKDFAF